MRSRLSHLVVASLVATSSIATAAPALAACHVVAFTSSTVPAMEEGMARVQVELQGRNSSCGGTVDYATSDGTAKAGQDYTRTTGTLTFVAGSSDDRVQDIFIPVTPDEEPEADETFDITLMNAQGSFGVSSSRGRATVVIADDDEAEPEPTPTETSPVVPTPDPEPEPEPTPTATSTPTPRPTPDQTPTPTPSPSPTPTPTESPSASESPSTSPTPTESPTATATPDEAAPSPTAASSSPEPTSDEATGNASSAPSVTLDDVRDQGGSSAVPFVLLALLVAAGVAGGLVYRRRSAG